MRRFDKKQNIAKANILTEQRYLQSKGLIKEGDKMDINKVARELYSLLKSNNNIEVSLQNSNERGKSGTNLVNASDRSYSKSVGKYSRYEFVAKNKEDNIQCNMMVYDDRNERVLAVDVIGVENNINNTINLIKNKYMNTYDIHVGNTGNMGDGISIKTILIK